MGMTELQLPAWARVLAGPLPRTTAAMLVLDELHRARNPLGAELAAKVRYVAAATAGCEYARRYAEADLRRAGLAPDALAALNALDGQPAPDSKALALVRKLTAAAYTVTDAEFAEVLQAYGPEKTVALVHTVAFANFHDRILLGLGVELEANEPLPPAAPRSRPNVSQAVRPWGAVRGTDDVATKPAWSEMPFTAIEASMTAQLKRTPRIPVPDLQRFASLPPVAKRQSEKIVWMTVSMGYQPEMTKVWFDALTAFRTDTTIDRVFANSMFWVITRTNECFY
jgi:alkylhydroperoxidase family enzyme